MSTFPVQTLETAPAAARPLLEGVSKKLGFVPNLYGAMANTPPVLEGFLGIAASFSKTTFSPKEQQLILLAASTVNDCDYCVAAHSTMARMLKTDEDVLEAARKEQALPDAKLDALVRFTRLVVAERGWVAPEHIDAFVAAGWRKEQVAEVVLGVAMKTLSNYFNHVNHTEVDAAFQANAWSRDAR